MTGRTTDTTGRTDREQTTPTGQTTTTERTTTDRGRDGNNEADTMGRTDDKYLKYDIGTKVLMQK